MRRAFVVAAAALAFAGCGPPTYSDFLDQVNDAWCGHEERCGVRAPSESGCAVPPPAIVMRSELDIRRAVDDKRMRYEPLNAKACIEAVKKAPCDPLAMILAVQKRCETVIAPRVIAYGACRGQDDCLGGRCMFADDDACDEGHCEPYIPVGGACSDDASACDPTVHYCDGNVCVARATKGRACADDGQCLRELRCVDGKCASQPRPHAGDPCDSVLFICRDSAFCRDGICVERSEENAPCVAPEGCKSGLVCAGWSIDATGTCKKPAFVGGACVAGALVSGCYQTMGCSSENVCTAGEAFAGWNETCATAPCLGDELECRSSICLLPGGIGANCSENTDCAPTLACKENRCSPC